MRENKYINDCKGKECVHSFNPLKHRQFFFCSSSRCFTYPRFYIIPHHHHHLAYLLSSWILFLKKNIPIFRHFKPPSLSLIIDLFPSLNP